MKIRKVLSHIRGYDILLQRRYLPEVFLTMDETPVWMDTLPGYTLDVRGVRHVNIVTTGRDKSRFTVVLTATKAGTKLTPLTIFPGSRGPKGRILASIYADPEWQLVKDQVNPQNP